jgi:F0F1-type ATP synthase membrane subunit b/b'
VIIERSHRSWLIGSMIVLAVGVLLYVPYSLRSVDGVSGGSGPGLAYGILGFAMMIFAGLLGARKRVRTWRLGRATWWMRGHLWIGFLSFPFILFHGGFQIGNGALSRALMILFFIVFVSGILGALLQHFMPKMMTERIPMETIYDQIDHVENQLVAEAAQLVADASAMVEQAIEQQEEAEERAPVAATKEKNAIAMPDERVSAKIKAFFETQIKPYLTSRRSQKYSLTNPVQAAAAFRQLKLLVPETVWPKFDDLESICGEKRELERQRYMHKWLHGWLLFHVPASYALILLGAVHAFVALRY